MHKPSYLKTLKSLVRCYQAFTALALVDHRHHDITEAQFDVIATLGNTKGMSCKELGEQTLITKGTLTGVLDRLEDKGLITRVTPSDNRRSYHIALTVAGEQLFHTIFPAHLAFMEPPFLTLTPDEHSQLCHLTDKLQASIIGYKKERENG